MINAYKTAYNANGGGKKGDQAGRDAMKGIFEDFSKVSAEFSEVERDATDATKGLGVQLEIFKNQLQDAVASQLFPEIVKLAPEIKALVPYVKDATKSFISLVKFFSSNPFIGIGGLSPPRSPTTSPRRSSVASSPTSSRVRWEALRRPLLAWAAWRLRAVGRHGQSRLVARRRGGAAAAAGTGLAVGGMIASMIVTAGVVNFDNAEVHMKEGGKDLKDARNLGIEDIEKLRELKQEQIKRVNEAKAPSFADSFGLGDFLNTSRAGEIKTQESFAAEINDRLSKLEVLKEFGDKLVKAGASQEEAAKKIAEAAAKLGVRLPDTGNAPSPVKP